MTPAPHLARAKLVHFVYHTARSTMEVSALLGRPRPLARGGSDARRNDRSVPGPGAPARAAWEGVDRELLRALLWQAELVKVVLEHEDPAEVDVGFPRPGRPEDERDLDWERRPGPAGDHFQTARDYRASVTRALDHGAHPHRALQRFFCDFDAETSADLIAELGWHPHVRALVQADVDFVRTQLLASLAERRADPLGGFAADRLAVLGEELARVGERLRAVVERHGLGPADLDEALERFACGELRLELDCRTVCCQPSSSYFFLFAELALALHAQAFEQRLVATAWPEELLLAFARSAVRSQEYFLAAYGGYARAQQAAGRLPDLTSYRAFDYDPATLPDANARAARRAEYAALDPAELRARSAANARTHLAGWNGG